LDRASGYEPEGREFESLRAHHFPSFSFSPCYQFATSQGVDGSAATRPENLGPGNQFPSSDAIDRDE
jgi:hypothetical protein